MQSFAKLLGVLGWPGSCNPPASATQGLGLQVYELLFLIRDIICLMLAVEIAAERGWLSTQEHM